MFFVRVRPLPALLLTLALLAGAVAVGYARWARPLADSIYGYFPGDTVYGYGEVINPVQTAIATSSFPTELALDATNNRLYVGHGGSGQVVRVDAARNLIFVKGGVPGARDGFVFITK